jgi:uncharacterized protein (DUF488 family)
LLTLGHSTLPIETFLKILRENGCTLLADIRTVPRSRHNPQFGQDELVPALDAAGIAYRWLKALGGLRRPRPDSINTAWRNTSFRGYADYMQTPEFASAVDELLGLGAERQTVILCAEAVPWRCHRSLVADALTARGVAVEDIFYDKHGSSHRKPHAMTSFARVDGRRVWYPAPLFAADSEEVSPKPSPGPGVQ